MPKHIAIYVRVSSKNQNTASQEADLKHWAAAQREPVKWYRDRASGRTMDRTAWNKLEANMRARKVTQVLVWRLDRLGRTASGLTKLFDDLQERQVNLVSIKDSVNLATPAGRMLANVLASVAQYENEVRRERQMAGIAAARAAGRTWGGSEAGKRKKVTPVQEKIIRHMKQEGTAILAIADAVGLSRPTVYSVLGLA